MYIWEIYKLLKTIKLAIQLIYLKRNWVHGIKSKLHPIYLSTSMYTYYIYIILYKWYVNLQTVISDVHDLSAPTVVSFITIS